MKNGAGLRMLVLMNIAGFVLGSAFAQNASFRGNAQHTGVYEGPGLTKLSGIKWSFHTPGAVISSPAIASGVVYFGSTDHNLYAVDATAGTLKWKFKTGSRISSSPAVADGAVYFESYDGNFYAVDALSGKEKWHFQTGGERRFAATHLHGVQPAPETMPDPFDVYLSSPAVVSGTIYFGSGDKNIYALDAQSGKLKWKFSTGDVVHASPAVADGVVFIGSWDSYFYALDAATGEQKWRFKTGEDPDTHNQVGIQSSAAVADGMVYFGCRDSNFYALDARTGEKKWTINNKGSWVVDSPAVQAGKLYFGTSDSGLLYAVDAKTGAILFSLTSRKWPMFSSPAIAGSTLIIGSNAGKLMGVDLAGQKITWEFETENAKKNGSQYINADGTPKYEAAFFGDFYDDMVAGVDRLSSLGPILSSPVVDGAVVYVGSWDGNLYALQ
jgi:eukaryotic-like serine/threonine-protein kinase